MKVYVWWVQAMGMATMLDEIINYVQSLQNQVEVNNLICNTELQLIGLCLFVFWQKKKKKKLKNGIFISWEVRANLSYSKNTRIK